MDVRQTCENTSAAVETQLAAAVNSCKPLPNAPVRGISLKLKGNYLLPRQGCAPGAKRPARDNTEEHEEHNESNVSDSLSEAATAMLTAACEAMVHFAVNMNNDEEKYDVLRTLEGVEIRHAHLTAAHLTAHNEESMKTVFSMLFTSSLPWAASVGTRLVTLDLESNSLGDEGVGLLVTQLLPLLPGLRRLLLASNDITAAGLVCLAQRAATVQDRLPALEVIGLTNNTLNKNFGFIEADRGTTGALLRRLTQEYSASLHRIHLNHVGLHTDDAVELLTGLTCGDIDCPHLDTVYMKQNANVCTSDVMEKLTAAKSEDQRAKIAAFVFKHVLI